MESQPVERSVLRLAIIAPNAWPAINPSTGTRIGGMETFAWGLATGLARRSDIEVTLLVRTTLPIRHKSKNGVVFHNYWEPLWQIRYDVAARFPLGNKSLRAYLRSYPLSFAWKLPLLALARMTRRHTPTENFGRTLKRLDVDAFLALGVSAESAQTLQVAREKQRCGLLWLRSNGDLDPSFFSKNNYQNFYGVKSEDCQACLRLADRIICQTRTQQAQLESLIGRAAPIIGNPVDLDRWHPNHSMTTRNGILWVGRYDRHIKRPLSCVKLAHLLPEISFRMIVNRGDAEVKAELQRTIPENVTLVDYVPHDAMPTEYRQARLFLNTSSAMHEGFPNVLLEAAASGTPIVAMQDCDDFIRRSQAGVSTNDDLLKLKSAILRIWNDESLWRSHSVSARRYVEQHHRREATYELFANLLRTACQRRIVESCAFD
ncbi:MAG: glycosyltransferase [Pirellulaceae bacterium]